MIRTPNRDPTPDEQPGDPKPIGLTLGTQQHRSYAAVVLAALTAPKAPSRGLGKSPSERLSSETKSETLSLDEALKTTTKAIDTAATVSTTCCRESLHNVRRCMPLPIRMANGTVLSAMYKGDVHLRLPITDKIGQYVKVTIPDVYYHEQFDVNLLSWGRMREDGWEFHSTKDGTHLITPNGDRTNASSRGRLTTIEDMSTERVYGVSSGTSKAIVCTTARDLMQMHRRLGHVSWSRLKDMCSVGATVGLADLRHMPESELEKAKQDIRACRACAEGKTRRKSLGHQGLDKGTRPGSVVHMDTFYASVRDPLSGEKKMYYCLSGIDAFTEWRWTETTDRMVSLPQMAIDILEHSHTLTGRYPRLIVADLGSEFANNTLKQFCRKHGSQYQPSPARAKELNGVAEKSVDTIKNHARAMLFAAMMPLDFGWRDAIRHFTYVWNRTHVGQHTRVTPYQAMTGREASVLNIGEFGCDVYVHQHRLKRDTTFDRKAEPGIYLGHSGRLNCPVVYMLRSGQIVESKDVHFREGSFAHLRAHTSGHPEDVDACDLSIIDDRLDELHDVVEFDQPPPDANLEQQYDVETVLASRMRGGNKYYYVKWVGYSDPTWEPAAIIAKDAPDMAREYEQSIKAHHHTATPAAEASQRITRSRSTKVVTFNQPSSDATTHTSTESSPGPPQPGPGPIAPAATAVSPSSVDELGSCEPIDSRSDNQSEPESESPLSQAATYAAQCL